MDPLDFEALMIQHYNTLLRIAIQHTNNRAEAEDIVQDTFLKLLETGTQFRDDGHAKAFLIRSVINRCKDYCKSARRTRNVALSDTVEHLLPADSGGFADDTAQMILDAMQQLRPDFRNVLYLYYYEEYSIREIAAILRKSSNTVSSWLTRAKNQLKGVLQNEQNDLSKSDAADFRVRGGNPHESKADTGAI